MDTDATDGTAPVARRTAGRRDLRPAYLVTVLYNSADHVAAFLESLRLQDMEDWRLIAVDNASIDNGAAELSGISDERIAMVRNPTNLGFAKAANQGMLAAVKQGAEFVVLINNDVRLPPGFLGRFMTARDEVDAGVIAPRIMMLDRPGEAWYAGGHFDDTWVFKNVHEQQAPGETRRIRKVEFASGCCLGISRNVLSQVGLLDESFFVYWEDTDFCLRLKSAGIPIYYVDDVYMMHVGGHSSGGENSIHYNLLYWRSYVQFVRKHFGIMITLRTMARIGLKEVGRPNLKRGPFIAMVAAMVRGLFTPRLAEQNFRLATGTKDDIA